MRVAFTCCVAALLLSSTAEAEASCKGPSDFFSVGNGDAVGPEPTVYFFGQKFWEAPAAPQFEVRRVASGLAGAGPKVPFEAKPLPGTPSWAVWQLKIHEDRPGELELSLAASGEYTPRVSSRLRIEVPAPLSPAVDLKRVYLERNFWKCSNHAATHIETTARPMAFRLSWAPTVRDFREGKPETAVFPPAIWDFWYRHSAPEGDKGLLALGDINCMGLSMPAFEKGYVVQVTALHADGSDTPTHAGLLRLPKDASAARRTRRHSAEPRAPLELELGAIVVGEVEVGGTRQR